MAMQEHNVSFGSYLRDVVNRNLGALLDSGLYGNPTLFLQ